MQQAVNKPERRLPALAVSRGIGIGRVVFLHGEKRKFFRIDLDAAQVQAEIARLSAAVQESIRQLQDLAGTDDPDPLHPVSSIFGVHLLILEESSLIEKIETVIRDNKVNAEWALQVVSDQYLEKQSSVADAAFREKYLDIEDVADRLMTALSGAPSNAQLGYSGAIVVASEVRPSSLMELTKSKPAALITERGGWTSHTSILAREFRLPMASGIRNLSTVFSHGDHVIVDSMHGEVILNPEMTTLKHFRKINFGDSNGTAVPAAIENPLFTLDGVEIAIRANVDLPEGYQLAQTLGARGIGLFRSESLIGSRRAMPSEDEQFLAYRHIADVTRQDGVNIRTFDIGSQHFGSHGQSVEVNPSLGLRSIRLSLSDSTNFRTQIRAMLRAAADRKISIALPMIPGVSEILRSKIIIDEERQRLADAGIPFGEVKLGAMIEIPSAVLTAGEIAQHVDFLCLGTNDLVQYLLAVDRDNDAVAEWYQTLHPAVIRAIAAVLAAAENSSIPVAVCGEMAGSPFYVPVLIGLGARELSMNVNSITHIRRLVSGISVNETVSLVERIKICQTAAETEDVLREYYSENWSGLFPSGLLNTKHR